MPNTTQVVRADVDATGMSLRLWVDDENAQHVCVTELRLGVNTLRQWVREVETEQNHTQQYQFDLD